MLEDSIDPRPQYDAFARFMAERCDAVAQRGALEAWLHGWNDRQSVWANLRDIGHWIDRSRP